jgi:hypothetical protein
MAWAKHLYSPPKGEGWGGPRKGASASRIRTGDPDGIQPMSNDPAVRARRIQEADDLHDHLLHLAKSARNEQTQLAATIAFIERIEGKAISRVDSRISGGEGGPINFTWMPPTE